MLGKKDPLHDSFLQQHLNPLFLEVLVNYWETLKAAEVSTEEQVQVQDALFNLIRFCFRHLFEALYLQYSPQLKGDVFLLTVVHSDGIGDYITLLKCAQLLQHFHPTVNVHVIYTHKQDLPQLDLTLYGIKERNVHAYRVTDDPRSAVLENVLEQKKGYSWKDESEKLKEEKKKIQQEIRDLRQTHSYAAEALEEVLLSLELSSQEADFFSAKQSEAEHLYQQIKKSLGLIHISLALNTFDNPDLARYSLYFSEAGNFQGIGNYLQRQWFSMGLDPFEEGIFIKKEPQPDLWFNEALTKYLWGHVQPSPEGLENYLKNHALYLAYLPRCVEQRDLYIKLVCLNGVDDKRHIDIILPACSPEQKFSFDHLWMKSQGVSKVIEVDGVSSIHEKVLEETDVREGKTLRLIYLLPIASTDFLKLMALSERIVGCTGDGSLSDCLKLDKIPFYEIRPHKVQVVQSFKHVAKKMILPDVVQYFELLEQISNWPALSFAQSLSDLISKESFKTQWHELLKFIRHYYCFEESFISHVNRHFFTSIIPALKEKEDLLAKDFFDGSLTAESAYNTLEQILKNHSSPNCLD